ncbi:MAG TPA: hypothetical protein VER11_28890 [Polyangiaceae bacterium]|nr:hypothetical protein [Polyangiaceae bacterium]
MPTTQLKEIAALVDQLKPIGTKQRGMRIEAGEWNTLVGVLKGVLAVARAQEEGLQVGLQTQFAAIDHEHLGQVSLAWLDPDLQQRLGTDGASGSVATRTALSAMTQQVSALGAEVARLSGLLASQQTALDRMTVDAADRTRTLNQFDARFAGVEGLKTSVSTLSNEVGGVRGNVDILLQLRKSLSDAAGNPIDIAGLKTQVSDLNALRDNLKGVDGGLVKLRDIEVKLGELSDAVGIGPAGALDVRINGILTPQLTAFQSQQAAANSAFSQTLTAQVSGSEARLRGEFAQSLDAQGKGLTAATNAQIAASEARSSSAFNAQLTTAVAGAVQTANDRAATLIDDRISKLPDVQAVTKDLIEEARGQLKGELSAELDKSLDTRFTTFQQNVDARVSKLDSRVRDVESKLPGLVATGIDALHAQLSAEVTTQVQISSTALRDSLTSSLNDQLRVGLSANQAQLNTALDARLANIDATVASSVKAATQSLPSLVTSEVSSQVKALNVAGQITTANNALATQLRGEIATAQADTQAKNATALNNSIALVRGELSATRTDLSNAISARGATSVGSTTVLRPNP